MNGVVKRRVLIAAVALLVCATLTIGLVVHLRRGPHGAPSAQRAVDGYLAALAVGDRDRLVDLADPDADNTSGIDSRLDRLGRGQLVITGMKLEATESDHMSTAQLTGSLNGAPYTELLWLVRHDDRWFVKLGPTRPNLPPE